MKIQLAIQGGGAKLTTLLGAASAIQDRQGKGQIKLSRIVGTSAGAIVGALLAAGIDIEAFRGELLAGLGEKIYSSLSTPSRGRWVRTALFGTPLWDTSVLETVLTEVLRKRSSQLQKPLRMLSDIKNATGIELMVVCADLRTPDPVVYKPNGNDKDIVTALMDSAGIPIYFRTWKHGSLVDGGLVQNFPWDELLEGNTQQYGPIIGISFTTDTRNIADAPSEYFGALLNTAMDSATERAKSRLGPDRIFTLPREYDTFDFKSALSTNALNNHYELIKQKALQWIDSRVRNSGILISDDPWKSTSISTMEKIGKMYESQHEGILLKYQNLQIQITAFTLQQNGESDVASYSFSFVTTDNPVHCHSVGLSQASKDSGSFKQSEITLIGPNGSFISAEYLPMKDPSTPEGREILLFFNDVLPAYSGPYTLTIRDVVQGLMSDLLTDRRDVLFTRCPRTKLPVDKVREVLHVPSSFPNAHMTEAKELRGRQVPGRAMTQSELIGFPSPSPGWITLGWVGDNVQPEVFFGPSITI